MKLKSCLQVGLKMSRSMQAIITDKIALLDYEHVRIEKLFGSVLIRAELHI